MDRGQYRQLRNYCSHKSRVLIAGGARVLGAITCGRAVCDLNAPPFGAQDFELAEQLTDCRPNQAAEAKAQADVKAREERDRVAAKNDMRSMLAENRPYEPWRGQTVDPSLSSRSRNPDANPY
jgi:hypothetical protein